MQLGRLPNLNQLRAFEAAARNESFKDAAEELHVTHAAISHQIKALEEDLGTQLFHRRARGVALMGEAAALAKELTETLNRMNDAVRRFTAQGMAGTLHITSAPFFANRLVIPRLPEFHALYPDLTIKLDLTRSVLNFRKENVDAGLRHGNGTWRGLAAKPIYMDTLTPMASPTRLGDRPLPLSPDEIVKMPLARVMSEDADWNMWFDAVGYSPPEDITIIGYSDRGLSHDMSQSGLGAALIDTKISVPDIARGWLKRLHPASITSGNGMFLVYPETDFPDPRVLAFGAWLDSVVNA